MSGKKRNGPEIQWDQQAVEAAMREHGVTNPLNLWPWRPYFVYRAFDADGVLLYIGCTMQPWVRFNAHRRQSHWYADAVRVDWEFAGQQAEARAAERRAILTEHPLHNIMLNQRVAS